MNKTVIALVIGISTLVVTPAFAQPPGSEFGAGYGRGPMGGQGGDLSELIARRLDHLDRQLNLSEEQRTRIEGILEEQMARGKGARGETRERIAAVLTDQQRDQFEQMRPPRGKGSGGRWRRDGGQ